MIKEIPVNYAKEQIRRKLGTICLTKGYKRIFTLLGVEGGLLRHLPSDVDIVSAENQFPLYCIQRKSKFFKHVKIYANQADMALFLEKEKFDFIWLDFFGNAFDDQNLSAIIQAVKKVTNKGMIVITSNENKKFKKNPYEHPILITLGLEIVDFDSYTNNRNKMSVFYTKKQPPITQGLPPIYSK